MSSSVASNMCASPKNVIMDVFSETLQDILEPQIAVNVNRTQKWPQTLSCVASTSPTPWKWGNPPRLSNMLLNTCTKIIANLFALSAKRYCFSSPQATMLHACMFAALLSGRHRLPSGHEIRFLVYSTQAPLHAFQLCIDMMVQRLCHSILTGWFGWFALETCWRKHVLQLRGQSILMHFASFRSLCIEHGKETCLNVLAIIGYRGARVMMPTQEKCELGRLG